ncbi:unnamed protein product [Protopolystoma xenopodis]|uniref:Uncharacterized protein n=1 Tax=Protopolystoma xenopodis TaxID=117903 RepID=A0A3S5FFK5_9PLAT|nr:unnamed protein product [Protopolystoma xenopodis]
MGCLGRSRRGFERAGYPIVSPGDRLDGSRLSGSRVTGLTEIHVLTDRSGARTCQRMPATSVPRLGSFTSVGWNLMPELMH